MQGEDFAPGMAVENAAGWFHDLPITGTPEFSRATAAVGVIGKLPNVAEDAFDKLCGSGRILECDVVSDRINIRQCGL